MKIHICLIILSHLLVSSVNGQNVVKSDEFNPDTIKSELLSKYEMYNGRLEDQTAELWDDYFLKSEDIGNIHQGREEIGWTMFHEGTMKYVESEPKGSMQFVNLEIHPINNDLAWVKGLMVTKMNDQVYKDLFYDSLVRTTDGWRVFLSVVNPA